MLQLTLGLLAVALVLCIFALRGRVVDRGRFCRGCRFDLQGHGPEAAACPECGRDLTRPKATRHTLRRVRWAPLAVAGLLLVIGAAAVLIQTPGAGARILAALPDTQVVRLADFGLDGAIHELAARATRVPPMADPDLSRAVDLALAHQADQSQTWDPRWGEVLAEAFVADRMTNDQLARYLTNGFEREIKIRDRVNRPNTDIGYSVTARPTRLHRLPGSPPVYSNRMLWTNNVSIGATNPGAWNRGSTGGMGGGLNIPNGPPVGSSSRMGSSVAVREQDWTAEEPHNELTVRAVFRVVVDDATRAQKIEITTIEHEQRVRLLAPSEPVVTTVTDTDAARQVAPRLGIEPFAILPIQANHVPQPWDAFARMGFVAEDPGHHVAGWFYLLDPRSGEEVRVARVVVRPTGFMIKIDWQLRSAEGPDDARTLERIISVTEAVLDAGVATLVFRTDPTVAETDPEIDAVLDLVVVFEDVPVRRALSESDLPTSVGSGTPVIQGRLVEPD